MKKHTNEPIGKEKSYFKAKALKKVKEQKMAEKPFLYNFKSHHKKPMDYERK